MKTVNFFLFIMLCVGFAACSDDDDTPKPLPENEFMTQEEFDAKVVNRLWEITGREWVDEEGNVLPEMEGLLGMPPIAYCFTDKGVVCFTGNLFSLFAQGMVYDAGSGWICYNGEDIPEYGFKIVSVSGNTLIVKTDYGVWQETPDSPFREDVCSKVTFTEVENPDWEWWFGNYRPSQFDPADLGLL